MLRFAYFFKTKNYFNTYEKSEYLEDINFGQDIDLLLMKNDSKVNKSDALLHKYIDSYKIINIFGEKNPIFAVFYDYKLYNT